MLCAVMLSGIGSPLSSRASSSHEAPPTTTDQSSSELSDTEDRDGLRRGVDSAASTAAPALGLGRRSDSDGNFPDPGASSSHEAPPTTTDQSSSAFSDTEDLDGLQSVLDSAASTAAPALGLGRRPDSDGNFLDPVVTLVRIRYPRASQVSISGTVPANAKVDIEVCECAIKELEKYLMASYQTVLANLIRANTDIASLRSISEITQALNGLRDCVNHEVGVAANESRVAIDECIENLQNFLVCGEDLRASEVSNFVNTEVQKIIYHSASSISNSVSSLISCINLVIDSSGDSVAIDARRNDYLKFVLPHHLRFVDIVIRMCVERANHNVLSSLEPKEFQDAIKDLCDTLYKLLQVCATIQDCDQLSLMTHRLDLVAVLCSLYAMDYSKHQSAASLHRLCEKCRDINTLPSLINLALSSISESRAFKAMIDLDSKLCKILQDRECGSFINRDYYCEKKIEECISELQIPDEYKKYAVSALRSAADTVNSLDINDIQEREVEWWSFHTQISEYLERVIQLCEEGNNDVRYVIKRDHPLAGLTRGLRDFLALLTVSRNVLPAIHVSSPALYIVMDFLIPPRHQARDKVTGKVCTEVLREIVMRRIDTTQGMSSLPLWSCSFFDYRRPEGQLFNTIRQLLDASLNHGKAPRRALDFA
jgi:hypothetical protein